MKMGMKNFSFAFLGPEKDVVQISFGENAPTQELTAELAQFFSTELARGRMKWILDFTNMAFPSTMLIAFVISATFRARNLGGDVRIISAKDSTRNNFVTFSPLSYLEFNEDAGEAYRELDVKPKTSSTNDSDDLWKRVDIAEPPIVESTSKNIPHSSSNIKSQREYTEDTAELEKAELPIRKEFKPNIRPYKESTSNNRLQKHYFKTESIASNLYKICDFIVDHSRAAGMDEKQIIKSKIAVYEACLNVIEHAYHSRPDNWIEVWVEYTDKEFKIIIQDHGLSYEKRKPKEYDVEAAVEKRQTGGFGLHIIERSMDDVTYNADDVHGNQLILTKFLK